MSSFFMKYKDFKRSLHFMSKRISEIHYTKPFSFIKDILRSNKYKNSAIFKKENL